MPLKGIVLVWILSQEPVSGRQDDPPSGDLGAYVNHRESLLAFEMLNDVKRNHGIERFLPHPRSECIRLDKFVVSVGPSSRKQGRPERIDANRVTSSLRRQADDPASATPQLKHRRAVHQRGPNQSKDRRKEASAYGLDGKAGRSPRRHQEVGRHVAGGPALFDGPSRTKDLSVGSGEV